MRRPKIRPIERTNYDAKAAGSLCSICPLATKGCQPVRPDASGVDLSKSDGIQAHNRLVIVSDYPDVYSEKHGKKVPTSASKFLDKSLISVEAVNAHQTWALLCRPPKDSSEKDINDAIEACKPRLARELEQVRRDSNLGDDDRSWILALGEEAFRATTGKLSNSDAWRGSPIEGTFAGSKVIPSWSPGYILSPKGTRYAGIWTRHLERSVQFSTGQLGDFVWPTNLVDENGGRHECLQKLRQLCEAGGEISVDVETRGLGLDSEISCIGFASDVGSCCVQLPFESADTKRLVRDCLRTGVMVGQNLALFDRRVLSRAGYALTDQWEDTLLGAAILDPQTPKNLGFLVSSEFHAEAHKAEFKSDKDTGVMQGDWDSTDPEVERRRRIYCTQDAYTTLLVRQVQKERLKIYGQAQYERLKLKIPVAIQMTERGMVWDAAKAERLKTYHQGKRNKIVAQMQKVVGPNFNPGSTPQLQKLFYETCKVAPFAWTDKGKPSTNEDVLTELLKSDNPFVVSAAQKIGEYRNHVKMLGTYVKGAKPLPGVATSHGNWKPHTAVTGRWSCTKFDDGKKEWGCPFQVVPERMRRLFKARPDMELVEADYAGLELRTLVLLSGAKHYQQMIADGVDMHLMNARQMFNMPNMPKKHPLRKATKVLSFLSHYVGGPQTAWQGLVADEDIQKWMKERGRVLTLKEVEAMQKAYFKIHPEIPAWWARNLEEANQRGYYLEPIFGRRVYFYGPAEISFASNFPNQALGAEICDQAMMRIWLKLKQPEEGFVAAVHDALALEGPDGQRLKTLAVVEMPTTLTYEGRTMNFPVECKVDKRYVRVK